MDYCKEKEKPKGIKRKGDPVQTASGIFKEKGARRLASRP